VLDLEGMQFRSPPPIPNPAESSPKRRRGFRQQEAEIPTLSQCGKGWATRRNVTRKLPVAAVKTWLPGPFSEQVQTQLVFYFLGRQNIAATVCSSGHITYLTRMRGSTLRWKSRRSAFVIWRLITFRKMRSIGVSTEGPERGRLRVIRCLPVR
jgi:hypothetical protein